MSQEGKTLDQLLDDEEPGNDTVEEAVPQDEPETQDGPQRDEKGRFASKAETGVEDTGPPPDKLPQEDYKAIREEREKRQHLERELEALRQQIQSQQQPKEPPAPPPSIWEDEQGWQSHFGGQLVSQAVQAATAQSRLQMSEMMMAQQHEDFAGLRDKLVEFVGSNPVINQQVAESQHPWSTAYNAYKNQQAMAELGATDLASLEAKMREKIMAEMQQGSTPVPQTPQVPPSLTGERNVGSRSGPAWAGPKPIEDLLA